MNYHIEIKTVFESGEESWDRIASFVKDGDRADCQVYLEQKYSDYYFRADYSSDSEED